MQSLAWSRCLSFWARPCLPRMQQLQPLSQVLQLRQDLGGASTPGWMRFFSFILAFLSKGWASMGGLPNDPSGNLF